MEQYSKPPEPSQVIVNGSLSSTSARPFSPTRLRRTDLGSPETKQRKNNSKIPTNSWRSPVNGQLSSSHLHLTSVPNFSFGTSATVSTSTSTSPPIAGLPVNGLIYPHGSGSHVFANKNVFGSPIVQPKITSHRNADNEEAMDIDGQEDMDTSTGQGLGGLSSLTQTNTSEQPMASHTMVTRAHLSANKTSIHDSSKKTNHDESHKSWKVLTSKLKLNEEKKPSPPPEKPEGKKGVTKKRAIYIVMHASRVNIGDLQAKASAPVKIYAEKIFVEVELEDHSMMSLRIPCKDILQCTVSFDSPSPVTVFTLTKTAVKSILDKNKDKGAFLHPDHSGDQCNNIVLHLNYNAMPGDVKEDIIELFYRRLSSIKWKELSSTEMDEFLNTKKNKPGNSHDNDPKPAEPAVSDADQLNIPSSSSTNPTQGRKILTPTKSRSSNRKTLFQESTSSISETNSTQIKSDSVTRIDTGSDVTLASKENKIVTRSRRRKAETSATQSASPPKTTASEKHSSPVRIPSDASSDQKDIQNKRNEEKERDSSSVTPATERDVLIHHSKMESHISLLGQHSQEQRSTLEHHQKLLSLERAERTRSISRIQQLESTNREKELFLQQQTDAIELLNREIEAQSTTVRQLQQELEQEREAVTRTRKIQTDLVQSRKELDEEKVVRGIRDKQLIDKETELADLRRVCSDENDTRRSVEDELQRVHNACLQHMDELENQRLFRQTQDHELQDREDRLQQREQQHQEEQTTRVSLEDDLRRIRIENDNLVGSRDALRSELAEERQRMRDEREAFSQERQNYEQRLRDSERALADGEMLLQELRAAVSTSQGMLEEQRRIEPRDWIIRREEVTMTDATLGTGAWGSVKVGVFRGCKVAVKQIHELILSPHNRRLFEREMSIASRCRHPCLLQFIGATNDDGIPLFLTEILDTDLRAVLTRRSLHQEEIIAIALDVARALNYLHLHKPFPIIHRDISSSNVLLWKRDTCWRAKLSDYGAANFMRQYMTVNPGAGIYAAPEASTSHQSPKVDIYSFGLLLCELCIRELPVPQQTQEQIALVTNGVMREFILRCVHGDPEARPTMAEVITLLVQHEQNLLERGLVCINGRSTTI